VGPNGITVAYDGKRNGARGPGVFQLDARVGYRLPVGVGRALDVFAEIFNATGHPGYDNPVTSVLGHPAADRRLTDFLVMRMLRPGSMPRTGQIGVRFEF
jgi:hypothetical protein